MVFFIKHHDDDEVDDEDAMMCFSDVLAHDAELERGQVHRATPASNVRCTTNNSIQIHILNPRDFAATNLSCKT